MKKNQLLRLVNFILFLSFILQTATIAVFFFEIKVPNKRTVFEIHKYNGLLMAILAVAHIVLNWAWIKTNFLKIRSYSKST